MDSSSVNFAKLAAERTNCGIKALSDNLFVSFTARSLPQAEVLWLNERYWRETGVDLASPNQRAALRAWLLDTYAFCIPTPDNAECLGGQTKDFLADRYGNSKGSLHGGSGRCGTAGPFNVKGIGATPLAASSDQMDWMHSHGCAWLEECLREAICSEIVCREFPQGGVPVVAIIDTGLTVHAPNKHGGGRRGLIVRPNFVRMAHLERSVYFGTGGTVGSEQYVDAQRTREAVLAVWGAQHRREQLGIRSRSLEESIHRYCDQMAYGYAHRFWLGDVSSSNVTIDGRIVDFGGFTSMPDWKRARGDLELPRFGAEWPSLSSIIKSLAFFNAKHLGRGEDVNRIHGVAERVLSQGFSRYLYLALTGGAPIHSPHAAAITECLRELFGRQQMINIDVLDNIRRHRALKKDWPYRYVRSYRLTLGDPGSPGAIFAKRITDIVGEVVDGTRLDQAQREGLLRNLEALLLGRPLLDAFNLYHTSRILVNRHAGFEGFAKAVTAYIDGTLEKSRARFPQWHNTSRAKA